ncbi:transposase [Catellatospora bangladeshensis]|uniref:transposase n=1 Tax=Catellatospora bangladeshensis TaxID=310355 RepID=UPI0036110524
MDRALDAVRLQVGDNPNTVAVAQIRALLPHLPPSGSAPMVAFDGGYDPVQLAVGLADTNVQTVVRIKSDRRFSARASVKPRSPAGGRPQRHGPRFSCSDPATWPTPTRNWCANTTPTAWSRSRHGTACTRTSAPTETRPACSPSSKAP